MTKTYKTADMGINVGLSVKTKSVNWFSMVSVSLIYVWYQSKQRYSSKTLWELNLNVEEKVFYVLMLVCFVLSKLSLFWLNKHRWDTFIYRKQQGEKLQEAQEWTGQRWKRENMRAVFILKKKATSKLSPLQWEQATGQRHFGGNWNVGAQS